MKVVDLYVKYKPPIQKQAYDKTVTISTSREKHELTGRLSIDYSRVDEISVEFHGR